MCFALTHLMAENAQTRINQMVEKTDVVFLKTSDWRLAAAFFLPQFANKQKRTFFVPYFLRLGFSGLLSHFGSKFDHIFDLRMLMHVIKI